MKKTLTVVLALFLATNYGCQKSAQLNEVSGSVTKPNFSNSTGSLQATQLGDPEALSEDIAFINYVYRSEKIYTGLVKQLKYNHINPEDFTKKVVELGNNQDFQGNGIFDAVDSYYKTNVGTKLSAVMKLRADWISIKARYNDIPDDVFKQQCVEVLMHKKENAANPMAEASESGGGCGWEYYTCVAIAALGATSCAATCSAGTAMLGTPACLAICAAILVGGLALCTSFC